jgi:osmotically-inducible protein OsmY
MDLSAHPKLTRQTTVREQVPAIGRTAEELLRRSNYLSLRDVSCTASDEIIYLHGCLPSYYLKQLAQELAAGVEGVQCVINRIEVLRPPTRKRPDQELLGEETD